MQCRWLRGAMVAVSVSLLSGIPVGAQPVPSRGALPPQTGAPREMASPIDIQRSEVQLDADLALARFCEQRGEPSEAEALYKQYLRNNPGTKHPLPYHRLGVLCAKQGKFDEGRGFFLHAVSLTPNNVQLLADLGYFYYLEERLDEAESVLVRALRLAPNDRQVTEKLALVLGVQGRYGDAFELFRRSLSEAESYSNLAYIYSLRGDLPRAKEAYNRALTLDPGLRRSAEAALAIVERERHVSPGQVATTAPSQPPVPLGGAPVVVDAPQRAAPAPPIASSRGTIEGPGPFATQNSPMRAPPMSQAIPATEPPRVLPPYAPPSQTTVETHRPVPALSALPASTASPVSLTSPVPSIQSGHPSHVSQVPPAGGRSGAALYRPLFDAPSLSAGGGSVWP